VNRTDRLLGVLLELQARGQVASRQLAEHFEVVPRTILRDLEALGQMVYPCWPCPAAAAATAFWRATSSGSGTLRATAICMGSYGSSRGQHPVPPPHRQVFPTAGCARPQVRQKRAWQCALPSAARPRYGSGTRPIWLPMCGPICWSSSFQNRNSPGLARVIVPLGAEARVPEPPALRRLVAELALAALRQCLEDGESVSELLSQAPNGG